MKYLKKFESYIDQDYGRFSSVDSDEQDWLTHIKKTNEPEINQDEEECVPCASEEEEETLANFGLRDEEEDNEPKIWGDEPSIGVVENKKSGKTPKNEKEKELAKKYPPKDKITRGDFIAAAIENKKKGKKSDSDEDKEDKGLTKAQSKLPEGLKKAIEAKNKKK